MELKKGLPGSAATAVCKSQFSLVVGWFNDLIRFIKYTQNLWAQEEAELPKKKLERFSYLG